MKHKILVLALGLLLMMPCALRAEEEITLMQMNERNVIIQADF